MPFTLAHGAAALPFHRTRLIFSALMVGTFAPDIEYFLRLKPGGGYGHTIPGAFVMSLPMALVTLWLFHRVVKVPFTLLMPRGLRGRLWGYTGAFRLSGARNFALIVASILVGIATHLVWDSFTHINTWLYFHWSFLRTYVQLPFGRVLQYSQLFQYVCSVLGCLVLLAWFVHWYRQTKPTDPPFRDFFSPVQRGFLLISVVIVATMGGLLRAYLELGFPGQRFGNGYFAGQAICTVVALAWWQLVAFGLLVSRRVRAEAEVYTQI